jgi:hypothetical protein
LHIAIGCQYFEGIEYLLSLVLEVPNLLPDSHKLNEIDAKVDFPIDGQIDWFFKFNETGYNVDIKGEQCIDGRKGSLMFVMGGLHGEL